MMSKDNFRSHAITASVDRSPRSLGNEHVTRTCLNEYSYVEALLSRSRSIWLRMATTFDPVLYQVRLAADSTLGKRRRTTSKKIKHQT